MVRTQLAEPKRFIVLAESVQVVEKWCLQQRLQRRDVVAVTPDNAHRVLAGLRGDFEVVTHVTWAPSPAVWEVVARRLRILGC